MRFPGARTAVNARMAQSQLRRFCPVGSRRGVLPQPAMEPPHLSASAGDRILEVARTIADLGKMCETSELLPKSPLD